MRISDWSSDVCSSDLALAPAIIERQHQPQYPCGGHRRVDDDAQQAALAFNPQAVLRRSGRDSMMIDEKARQHEHARHPEDDEDPMRGLDPEIVFTKPTDHLHPPRTSTSIRSP